MRWDAEQRANERIAEADRAAEYRVAAAEEEARLNGYARPDEKLYLISRPSPAASSAATTPDR